MIRQDYVNNWRKTALVLTSVLFLAAGIWVIGNIFVTPKHKFRQQGNFNKEEQNEMLSY